MLFFCWKKIVTKLYRKNYFDLKDEKIKYNNLNLQFSTRNFCEIWRNITLFQNKNYFMWKQNSDQGEKSIGLPLPKKVKWYVPNKFCIFYPLYPSTAVLHMGKIVFFNHLSKFGVLSNRNPLYNKIGRHLFFYTHYALVVQPNLGGGGGIIL